MDEPRRRRRRGLIIAAGLAGIIMSPPAAPARRAAAEWARRYRYLRDPAAPFLQAPCHTAAEAAEPIATGAEATK